MDESLGKSCKLCGYVYCVDHLLPQRHQCAMLQNVEYVKADLPPSVEPNVPVQPDSNNLIHPSAEKVSVIAASAGSPPYWLSDCIKDAKDAILEHHDEKPDDTNFSDCKVFCKQDI